MNKKFTSTSPKLSGQTMKHHPRITQILLLALVSVLYHAKCVLQTLYAPFRGVVQKYSRVTKLHTVLLQASQLKIGRIFLPLDSRIRFQRLNHFAHRHNYDDNDEFNGQKFLSRRLPIKVLLASFSEFVSCIFFVKNKRSRAYQEYLNEPGALSVLKFKDSPAVSFTAETNPNRGYYNYPEPTTARLSTISSLFVYANHNPL